MPPESIPTPEYMRLKAGDVVRIPDKYVSPEREYKNQDGTVSRYLAQKPENWVIIKIILKPDYGYGPKPYAIVQENNGRWTAGSQHIPLDELEAANPKE